MKAIKTPPSITKELRQSALAHASQSDDYIKYFNAVDTKGRYLPYDEFYYRLDKGIDVDTAWALTKQQRMLKRILLPVCNDNEHHCSFNYTSTIHKAISSVDRNTTNASLQMMVEQVGEEHNLRYLFSDLYDEEAISSSQLEGAATTTIIAREMIQKKRKPRTLDERMIIGNFKLMKAAWNKKDEPLSIELIKELHFIGMEGIDDDNYTPGVFRKDNSVVVEDRDQNIIHQPPDVIEIEDRLETLCQWTNEDHDNEESEQYLHPLIKAIVMHFTIGFTHPFKDGNGRIARALFYWYMFSKGFGVFRYIAISKLLKEAPVQYGKSYLYTETDEMDLTYFIDFQCKKVIQAINNLKSAHTKAFNEKIEFERWLFESGLYGSLSEKQRVLLNVGTHNQRYEFTIKDAAANLQCSENTASKELNGLVEKNFFNKKKDGRIWVFTCKPRKLLKEAWHTK